MKLLTFTGDDTIVWNAYICVYIYTKIFLLIFIEIYDMM